MRISTLTDTVSDRRYTTMRRLGTRAGPDPDPDPDPGPAPDPAPDPGPKPDPDPSPGPGFFSTIRDALPADARRSSARINAAPRR